MPVVLTIVVHLFKCIILHAFIILCSQNKIVILQWIADIHNSFNYLLVCFSVIFALM